MLKTYANYCFLLLFTFLFAAKISAQSIPAVVVANAKEVVHINSGIEFLEDTGHAFSPESVFKSTGFRVVPDGIPNEKFTSSAFWFRFKIKNETTAPYLILKLSDPPLDSITYYEQMGPDSFRSYRTGQALPFDHREYLSSDFLFTVSLPPHAEKYVYLRICASAELLAPLTIGTQASIFARDKYKDIFWGIYIGIMLAMLLYNCFVYSTTSDDSYLYYIVYVLTVVVTQITISGYGFQLLWPNHLLVAKYSAIFNPVLAGIAAIGFIRSFLKTRSFVPKSDKVFVVFAGLYGLGAVIGFFGNYGRGLNVIDMTAGVLSIYVLAVGFVISRKGYRPAVFFMISWLVFLLGVFIFVFKNLGILPYNVYTVYTMPVGSAMEVLLLSFALADRINILKKEAAASQAKELQAVQEKERMVQEQNVLLEGMVSERTNELVLSNQSLNKALVELKEAELQLVESEKMASLGQLTAGIAHEINNPISFASSNIKPLGRDVRMLLDAIATLERIAAEDINVSDRRGKVQQYKNDIDLAYLEQEIGEMLTGIDKGVSRTAEVVKVLRLFSRLDEGDLKTIDINESLDATLAFVNDRLGNLIKVEKRYTKLSVADCFSGKLNQAFLNIISNAIYAIKQKFGEQDGGVLTISTLMDKNSIIIKVADNGTGMEQEVMSKAFDPFFTTKKVGEGVGLGLAIAFSTVRQHNGKIQITSEPGIGTEVTIVLPMNRK